VSAASQSAVETTTPSIESALEGSRP
jgi:hypothetical protein